MLIDISINNEINYLELISNVISSLAWPITVLMIIFTFRKQLESILKKITKITFGGNEFSLADDLTNVSKSPNDEELINENATSETDFLHLAKIRPDLAIIDSYKALEEVVRNIYEKRYRKSVPYYGNPSPVQVLKLLLDDSLIDNRTMYRTKKVRDIRNNVIHNFYPDIDYSEALLFDKDVKELIKILDSIT